MYQSGRAVDEAKKRKCPAKSGRAGITGPYMAQVKFDSGKFCFNLQKLILYFLSLRPGGKEN